MVQKDSANNNLVTVTVSDTGIGIPPEHIKEIFEPFHQLDGSATRRYGGTGLGLALVRQIVEAHGSLIDVQSEINKGTKISFPLVIAKAE
jgi:signal transduction histidine kinase